MPALNGQHENRGNIPCRICGRMERYHDADDPRQCNLSRDELQLLEQFLLSTPRLASVGSRRVLWAVRDHLKPELREVLTYFTENGFVNFRVDKESRKRRRSPPWHYYKGERPYGSTRDSG